MPATVRYFARGRGLLVDHGRDEDSLCGTLGTLGCGQGWPASDRHRPSACDGGIESEGAERRILVGGQHAVPPSIFPGDAAYVALGHLHKPQAVGGNKVRYSGSLLPLSATETGYCHGVTLVTLDAGVATSEHIPISRPVPFLRLPHTGDLRVDELGDHLTALSVDPDLPVTQQPFIQVQLSRNGLEPGHRARIDQICADFPVRVVGVSVAREDEATRDKENVASDVRLAELQPLDMFVKAFAEKHGMPPEPTHLEAFHKAAAAAEAQD